jgi:hypothetical protein
MVSFSFSVVFIQLQSYTIIIGIAEKVPVIVPRFDKNSRFTCNRLVFIRPARKKNLFVLFSPCFVLSLRPIRT